MEKTFRTEIENEYKSQIVELEENLGAIAQFEADVKISLAFKILVTTINFIFSWAFLLIGMLGLIALTFYFTEALNFVDQKYKLGIDSIVSGNGSEISRSLQYLKYLLIAFSVICLLLSSLLKTIRRKNILIVSLNLFVSDFKMRSVRMYDQAMERLKNFHKLRAQDQFVNRQ